MTASRGIVIAALAVGAGMLAACGVQPTAAPSAPESSAAQLRAEFFSNVDTTQQAVGGRWENQDDPMPRGCALNIWSQGQAYPALRIGSPPTDLSGALIEVRDMWVEWGYVVERLEFAGVTELQGHRLTDVDPGSHAGELLVFRASPNAVTLQGESECLPA
jgi:hypothetical protein